MITINRREFIKRATAITGYSILSASSFFKSQTASAEWIEANFAPSPLNQTLKTLLKNKPVIDTDKINIKIPKTADNKTPVLITVQSDLKGAKAISILVEQNPVPLAATFQLSPSLDPFVSARLKLLKTSFVFVLIETEKVFYSAKEIVAVSLGGCEA